MNTQLLLKEVINDGQDWEWYPTTQAMLDTIKSDMEMLLEDRNMPARPSVLDCGAGDGRALMSLTEGKRYAIEKSRPLITAMDRSIFVVGADFMAQQLVDKCCDVTFSNPPYSCYEAWTTKILSETRSGVVYMVIPRRWHNSQAIKEALELRNASFEVIGEDNFLGADRKARAVVEIVRFEFRSRRRHGFRDSISSDTDPFRIWFDQNIKITAPRDQGLRDSFTGTPDLKAKVQKELVSGSDIVSVLVNLYEKDMASLIGNYKKLELLDYELFEEMGVDLNSLREGLLQKVSALKNHHWRELFDNFKTVTSRLTHSARTEMLDTLMSRTDVDFNPDNCYAVAIWVVKNANTRLDDAIVELVETMTEKANISLYKSNQQTFGDEKWRYCRTPEDLARYKLEYRIVLERVGGIRVSDWEHERNEHSGLTQRAYRFIQDVLTVANNIGFDTTQEPAPMATRYWVSREKQVFYFRDHKTGADVELMTVRAYQNGNLHIKFNQAFICRLNVEFGRLKGWLKDHFEAESELGVPAAEAEQAFGSNLKLGNRDLLAIGLGKTA